MPVKGTAALACLALAAWVATEIIAVRQTAMAIDRIKRFDSAVYEQSPGFFQWLFSASVNASAVRGVILVLAAVVVLMCLLRFVREVVNITLSMWMVFGIREAVYQKLQTVGFSFHDRVPSGQLINRALGDLQNVRMFVQTAVLTTFEILLVVGGYILLIGSRQPWVALLSLAPLPVWLWYVRRFGRKIQPSSKEVFEAEDRNVTNLSENIAGVHVVRAFATEANEISKYQARTDDYHERVRRRIDLFADFVPVLRLIGAASHLSLFAATALFIIHGRMNVGDFLILGSAMGSILGRLQQVNVISEQYQNAIVSARRLYEVLHAEPNVKQDPEAAPLPAGTGDIAFENVSFGYDPQRPVLHDVSFTSPGGKLIALVGPTGAGKSTLVGLLARFYDPQQGRILLDGVELSRIQLGPLRRAVSYVFQETFLFSDSIAANIAYGRPDLIRQMHRSGTIPGEIESASRLAQAHDFISEMPDGYWTVIGERGSSLSGGQRQRLAIARAILADARVLVLDDATAAIDPETEDLIRRGLRAVMHGRTVFVIAHRISSVRAADLVLVIEHGRITQQGTHDELVAEGGHYKDIVEVQLYGDTPEEHPSHMDRMRRYRREEEPHNDADDPVKEQQV